MVQILLAGLRMQTAHVFTGEMEGTCGHKHLQMLTQLRACLGSKMNWNIEIFETTRPMRTYMWCGNAVTSFTSTFAFTFTSFSPHSYVLQLCFVIPSHIASSFLSWKEQEWERMGNGGCLTRSLHADAWATIFGRQSRLSMRGVPDAADLLPAKWRVV